MTEPSGPGDTDAGSTYRLQQDGISWRETGGEIVVLDMRGSVYFGLNATGSVLWKALQRSTSRGDLVAELVASAPVGPATAAADVDAFLAHLQREGLLVRT